MTYRVSRSASNYELQNDHPNGGSEPYLHHYVHNPAQSASVANIQQLATLQVSVISVVEFQGAELIICKLLKSRILIFLPRFDLVTLTFGGNSNHGQENY